MKIDPTDTTSCRINAALVQGRRAIGSPAVGMVLTLVIATDEENAYDALGGSSCPAGESWRPCGRSCGTCLLTRYSKPCFPHPTHRTGPDMKKVLFVLTSHGELGDSGRPTGFHLGETIEPWQIIRDARHQIDFVSVRGGRSPMIGYDPDDPAHDAFLKDPAGGLLLDTAGTPEEVDPDDYSAVYFVGGHGTMWDFRGHPALESLARRLHESGGVVSAICHGPAALVDVRLSDGSHLVAGRALTSFADAHEQARGLDGLVPFPLQRTLEERGAVFSHAPDKMPHVVVSGRLVTAQNPASARELGVRIVELLSP
ncbi:type 1 glutamine amidotransferase domain-containing protein [Streptomyces ochraceiscleroticus]|uniref:DJ-1/PfpI family protein n=1 Tax=Streptomyces ochraceiscleroticus TaxID=47761 RepID=A0ABW1MQR7_9ACTN|nr:type 1 glutamine amidotransferase domain-containing protein [Streptomyces ochraceiscleroticus]